MATDITTIKNWFKTGLKPTQAQFWATWDSYWHKDESISISSVENLEKLLNNKADNTHEHSQYATNDASSLTDDNVISWQKALKIDDLKFDDQAITTTQDYLDFGLEKGATINSFNNAIYQSVKNKLDTPTEEGTTEDYPFVVGVNEDNESVKLPAGDLGKNFANTDLTVTENRKHTGTNTVEFGMPLVFSNANQQFKNLPDKSADATYNELVGKDSNGNIAKVGINALTKTMQNASDNDKDVWRKAQLKSDESYSTGQPVIDAINPPIIKYDSDYTQYISIIGTNLYIDNGIDSMAKLEIRNIETNEITIIENFESYQINPSILTFPFTKNMLPKGVYLFRVLHNNIWSMENSAAKLFITDNATEIPLPSLTWSIKDKTGNKPQTYIAGSNEYGVVETSNSVRLNMYKNKDDKEASSDMFVAKSNEPIVSVEELSDGILLEFDIDWTTGGSEWIISLGLVQESNFLNNTALDAGVIFNKDNGITHVPYNKNFTVQTIEVDGNETKNLSDKLLMIINNGLITIYLKSQGKAFSQQLDISKPLYLKMYTINRYQRNRHWADGQTTFSKKIKLTK